MAEKEVLQQHLGSMRLQLSSLDDLCDAARKCLAHTENALAEAAGNAKAHGEELGEIDRQRYALMIKEAQENVTIALNAREQFHSKLRQMEDRIARL